MNTHFRLLATIFAAYLFTASILTQALSAANPPIAPLPDVSGTYVATLPATFDVNDSGAATYTIPLAMPPGTAGMAPKLTLQYNSGKGSGILGPGWSLTGLSAITRCPSTQSSSGYARPVMFDQGDEFCLDGQPLMAIAGTYGAAGSEYRTIPETFAKVTAAGQLGVGPLSFTVMLKNGLIYEYGTTEDSRLTSSLRTEPLAWQLSRVSDRSGNYYTVTYAKDAVAGESLPLRIDYTGNSPAGLAPYNSVRFEYEPLSAALVNYTGGISTTTRSRLRKITTYTDQDVSWYFLIWYQHEKTAQEDHVTTIFECDKYNYCARTNFTWGIDYGNSLDFAPPTTLDDFFVNAGLTDGDKYPVLTGDWNGDGKVDIGRIRRGGANGTARFYFRDNGLFTRYADVSNIPYFSSASVSPVLVGDFTGDGRSDFAVCNATDFNCYIYRSTGSNFANSNTVRMAAGGSTRFYSSAKTPLLAGDWNGDGKTDLLMFTSGRATAFYANTTDTWTNTSITINGDDAQDSNVTPAIVGDWNGDGLMDFARVYTTNTQFFISNGTGFSLFAQLNDFSPQQGYTDANRYPLLTGDWNADGLTDFARVTGSGVQLCYATGTGFGNCQTLADLSPGQGYTNNQTYPIFTGDWNGDGFTDIARVTSTGTRFYNIKGTNIYGPYDKNVLGRTGGFTDSKTYPILVGDFSGDGFTDLGRVDANNMSFYTHLRTQTNLITSITDLIGAKIDITYTVLTSLSPVIYTKGTGAVYPIVDAVGAMNAVASVAMGNGLGSSSSIHYQYKGLRYDFSSQSFLGFAEIDATDDQRGITTSTFYRQDGLLKGTPFMVDQRLASGALIGHREESWKVQPLATGNAFLYLGQTIENAYELDGNPIRGIVTTNQYDDFNNLVQSSVQQGDGSTEVTFNVHNNDTSNWFIGQLQKSTVTKKAAGGTALTRMSRFTYASASGLLTTEEVEPGNAALGVSKSYAYDGFGNIIQVTVSAAGVDPRTTSTAYDSRGQFPVRSTNSLGQVENRTFDVRHGTPKYTTRIDGTTITTFADGVGRPWYEYTPDGVPTRYSYFKAPAGSLSNATYLVRRDRSGESPVITYYDQLGRDIRKEEVGLDGQKIFTDKVYDERGQLSLTSAPYFEGQTPLWTAYEYDVLGRPVRVTEPGGRVTSTVYRAAPSASYNVSTISVTNPLGQTATETVNTLGQVIASQDAAGNVINFFYDSYGNLTEMRDPAGNRTLVSYDLRGNKTKITDPDTGVTSFEYNPLGELTRQVDARGQATVFSYDKLGRLVRKDTPEGPSTWTYDTAAYGIGKLAVSTRANGYRETSSYDSLGRLTQETKTIGSATLAMRRGYDQYSRISTLTYPSGFAVTNVYDITGNLSAVQRSADSALLWRADTKNARSEITAQTFGNGLQMVKSFDPNTGLLQSIVSGNVQSLAFTFDGIGNLTRRQDLRIGASESFTYDSLNRLTSSQVAGQPAVTMSYNAIGNITSRSDVGSYLYGGNGAGPHALTAVQGAKANSYSYDASGNRVASANGAISFSSGGQPVSISQGSTEVRFILDTDERRVDEATYYSGNLLRERFFFDELFELVTDGSTVQQVHYILGAEGPAAVYTSSSNGTATTHYLHTDHLGSPQTITNETGAIVETLSFDPWGSRRAPTTWASATTAIPSEIDHGFTGHEQLDAVGLVHMKGRVYDPAVGRFVSADPFVQAPKNLQSLNRYSYVANNPLSLVDPSGFFLKGFFRSIGKLLKKAVPIAITVAAFAAGNVAIGALLEGHLAAQSVLAIGIKAAGASIIASSVGAVANGGSISDGFKAGIRNAPLAALRSVVAFEIGEGFSAPDDIHPDRGAFSKIFGEYSGVAKVAAHGLGSAAVGAISGERFVQAFAGGAFGEVGSGFGLVGSALAGGTAAALSGGKFENGAMQGAFVYLYNDCLHPSGPPKSVSMYREWIDHVAEQIVFGASARDVVGDIGMATDMLGQWTGEHETTIGYVSLALTAPAMGVEFLGMSAVGTIELMSNTGEMIGAVGMLHAKDPLSAILAAGGKGVEWATRSVFKPLANSLNGHYDVYTTMGEEVRDLNAEQSCR